MTDNMKGLLHTLIVAADHWGSRIYDGPRVLKETEASLRAAVEGMELQLQLTQAEHASCHDEAAHYKREEWQQEIAKLKERIQFDSSAMKWSSDQLDIVTKGIGELKLRLEGAHVHRCRCMFGPGVVEADPRCVNLRKII